MRNLFSCKHNLGPSPHQAALRVARKEHHWCTYTIFICLSGTHVCKPPLNKLLRYFHVLAQFTFIWQSW